MPTEYWRSPETIDSLKRLERPGFAVEFLRRNHCDEIQGYYFSRPITAAEVAEKLANARMPGKVLAMPARAR